MHVGFAERAERHGAEPAGHAREVVLIVAAGRERGGIVGKRVEADDARGGGGRVGRNGVGAGRWGRVGGGGPMEGVMVHSGE